MNQETILNHEKLPAEESIPDLRLDEFPERWTWLD
jgi:hypothetical protein